MAFGFRRHSIATRLFVSAIAWSLLILLVAGLILSTIYRRTTERAFDERLDVYLTDLVSDLATPGELERKELGTIGEPRFELPLSGWYWQVTRLNGGPRDLRTSKSLFGGQLPKLADLGVPAGEGGLRKGYATGPDERNLRILERVIDLGEDGRFHVAVAAPDEEIENDIRSFGWALGLTFAALGVALGLTTLAQVRYGLLPLIRLRKAVADVRRGDAEHIEGKYPHDIAPLAGELNLMIDANREILGRARTHVGNLAHALKTPLSVIVNEADGMPGPFADKVREQAAVMRDQINYYLDRARAAALAGTLGTVTEVAPVLVGLKRALGRIYRDRDLAVEVAVPEGTRFRGERQDFEDMVGNLADNACKWAQARVAVAVDVFPDGERSTLQIVVDDDGPGLPPEARSEVMRRGKRLDETKPGSGLGLAIAADLADLYGGTLVLDDSPLGGLRAVLRLPGV
ncbi:sensor histidine kinase [Chelatococcus sp. SYSU_G07232]|uniref:histidine kinase n=1 Tax=Chelatococcus albus TaxID=3047466 RepID=A0ABT7AI26_9HYPH|nr:sensor histidine kinase [Chelatococcus sp. SYSU_G07232]MDJ1159013.1 sensor histidine kinase [Chelatococcus sp. SYSU_G07232]